MRNYAQVIEAYDKGRFHQYEIRKVSGSIPSNRWFDLSYSGGLPLPNYYASAPLVMEVMEGNKGIFKGPRGGKKYIHKLELMCGSETYQLQLLDYIAYIPFIDLDSTDQQDVEWAKPLPRFEDGNGVRVMAVCQGAGGASTTLTMTYLNQDGIEKTASTVLEATQASGVVITSGQINVGSSVWMRMATGDSGIRKILSVTNSVSTGAICTLVIVKPICNITLAEKNTPGEVDYLIDRGYLPSVHEDAYLNFIAFNSHTANITPNAHGYIQFVWEEE